MSAEHHGLIYTIMEDSENNLWLGTEHGLCKFDRQTDRFTCFPVEIDGRVLKNVRAAYEYRPGVIWVGSRDWAGLFEFDVVEQRFREGEHIKVKSYDQADLRISTFYENHSGDVWIGLYTGLLRFDKQTTSQPFFLAT